MEKKHTNTRRSFLKTVAKGTVITSAVPLSLQASILNVIPSSVKGANDRIRVAVLGINGRGKKHIDEIMKLANKCNIEVAVLCDPDMNILQDRAKSFEKKYGKKIAIEQDFRRTYEDKSIDAVTLAIPNSGS